MQSAVGLRLGIFVAKPGAFNGDLVVNRDSECVQTADSGLLLLRYATVPIEERWWAVHFLPDRRHFLSLARNERDGGLLVDLWHAGRTQRLAHVRLDRNWGQLEHFVCGDLQVKFGTVFSFFFFFFLFC